MTDSSVGRSGDGDLVLDDPLPPALLDGLRREALRYLFTPPHPRAGEEWVTTPGEVILLRGWSQGCDADPRPHHRVDPPVVGTRVMFPLRRNLGAEPLSTWPSELGSAELGQARSLASTPESPRVEN